MSPKNQTPTDPNLTDSDSSIQPPTPSIDTLIIPAASLAYWSQVNATNDGMLGGYEDVTGPDLKQSKRFISQVRRILQTNPPKRIDRAVDCGAGIGRITKGLLLKAASTVDVVEPIAKFAGEVEKVKAQMEGESEGTRDGGEIGDIFIQGLESWEPPAGRRYSLIWNQWCLGHLTDAQLISYLKRAAKSLTGTDNTTTNGHMTDSTQEEKGWIMVKENLSKEQDGDIFDDQDSSVTRTDGNFRRIFEEAGLGVVKSGRQENFPSELYTVMMYALRPS